MKPTYKQVSKRLISIGIIIVFLFLSYYFFEFVDLWQMVKKILSRPALVPLIFIGYFLSFCLKAWAWKLYLHKRPRFLSCLLGIFYSLFINHITPIKVGDLVRAGILSSRDKIVTTEESLHSVVVLRILDMTSLLGFGILGIVLMDLPFSTPIWLILIAFVLGAGLLFFLKIYYSQFLTRHLSLLKSAFSGVNGWFIFLLTITSWVLEAVVLYGSVIAIDKNISFIQSIWINSVTVAGQVFQITPGGIANYETIMTFALGLIGITMKEGYLIAILTHSFKFIFSYIGGAFAIIVFPVSLKVLKSWMNSKGVLGK
jgi:glycosyltransferase AglD